MSPSKQFAAALGGNPAKVTLLEAVEDDAKQVIKKLHAEIDKANDHSRLSYLIATFETYTRGLCSLHNVWVTKKTEEASA